MMAVIFRQGRKGFFFEKKKQKTFGCFGCGLDGKSQADLGSTNNQSAQRLTHPSVIARPLGQAAARKDGEKLRQ
jgi:hypothetical protein